eukprot:m.260125 g.260125  ORF g.260125 m.260125 type:complete len:235 (+) comp19210_c0_seq2:1846-2550(+)
MQTTPPQSLISEGPMLSSGTEVFGSSLPVLVGCHCCRPNPQHAKSHVRKIDCVVTLARTEKELGKLIGEIQRLGTCVDTTTTVAFGILFEETANVFEALSGTLLTAKKHGIVAYEGQLLLQGFNDNVSITLVKTEVEAGAQYMSKRTSSEKKLALRRSLSMGTGTMKMSNPPCHSCGKTVYPTEYVGASDKAFHNACFRCSQCGNKLQPTTYATIDNQYFCRPHYEQFMKANFL